MRVGEKKEWKGTKREGEEASQVSPFSSVDLGSSFCLLPGIWPPAASLPKQAEPSFPAGQQQAQISLDSNENCCHSNMDLATADKEAVNCRLQSVRLSEERSYKYPTILFSFQFISVFFFLWLLRSRLMGNTTVNFAVPSIILVLDF
jgi:hypothetical protein